MRAFAYVLTSMFAFVLVGCGDAQSDASPEATDAVTATTEDDVSADESTVDDGAQVAEADSTDPYAEQVRIAAELDRDLGRKLENWKPSVYLMPDHVTDPSKREEFREIAAQYRTAIDDYEADMNEFYDEITRIGNENGEDVEEYTNQLRDALSTTIEEYHKTADEYLAYLAFIEEADPGLDSSNGDLLLRNEDDLQQYNEITQRIRSQEQRRDAALAEFERLRANAF